MAKDEQKELRSHEAAIKIGRQIKSIRILAGLNQQELAEQSGLATNTLCRIEMGRFNVGIRQIAQILDALHYELDVKPLNTDRP